MRASKYLFLLLGALLLSHCKFSENQQAKLRSTTTDIYISIGDESATSKSTLVVSTAKEAAYSLCVVKKGGDCPKTQTLFELLAPVKKSERFFYKTKEEVSISAEWDYLVVDSNSRSMLLRFKFKDLRGNSDPAFPDSAPSSSEPKYSVDITGNDTLSDGTSPRSRTGALLTAEYLLTCLHNHQKIRMDDNLPESNWWANSLGPAIPLYRSPISVRRNQTPDLIVVAHENFKDLDLALIKIKWINKIPDEQAFVSKIAIGNSVPPNGTDVTSVGFPRDTYLPRRKFASHRGKFLGLKGSDMTYSGLDIRLGDSGSPVIAKGPDGRDILVSLVHAIENDSKIALGTDLTRLYTKSETLRRLFDENGNAIGR